MKKFLAGLIAGLIIATTTSVIAATETPITGAVYSAYNVIVNGSAPQQIETITYNQTAYYPVRLLSNLLGYDVTWKADTRTIELTGTVTSDVYDVWAEAGLIDVNGVQYYATESVLRDIQNKEHEHKFEFVEDTLQFIDVDTGEVLLDDVPHTIVDGKTYIPSQYFYHQIYKMPDPETETESTTTTQLQGGEAQVSTRHRIDGTSGAIETTWNDMKAIEYTGNTYFLFNDFDKLFMKPGDGSSTPADDKYSHRFDGDTYNFYYYGEHIIMNLNDPEDVVIYLDQVYWNIDLFPTNAKIVAQPAG